MNKREMHTLVFIAVFVPFLLGFGYISLLMISIGSTIGSIGGVIVGIGFLLTIIFCGKMVFGWWKGGIKAIAKQEEIDKHSTRVKAWANSTATLVDLPENEKGIKHTKLLFGELSFCPHLENVNSLMVKCPKCKYTFPRFYYQPDVKFDTQMLKSGEVTAADVLRHHIRINGFPSEIHCIRCGESIYRSRPPSGRCSRYGTRVTGDKLFCCTINQCTG